MDVIEIIRGRLEKNGFDGLCRHDSQMGQVCWCGSKSLMTGCYDKFDPDDYHVSEMIEEIGYCMPGYRNSCSCGGCPDKHYRVTKIKTTCVKLKMNRNPVSSSATQPTRN